MGVFALERRYRPDPELRVAEENGKKTLFFYASVFDSLSEDLGGFKEKIGRRAFTKTLQEQSQRIFACFNHNPDNLLGRTSNGTLTLRTDLTGLLATVELPDTQLGRDIAYWVDRGDLSGASFSFAAVRDRWSAMEDGTPLREILEARLYEVSPVVSPAYPATDGSMALRAALAGLTDGDPDDLAYPLLRSALAGNEIKAEDLIRPLLRARAGQPLAPEERDRFRAILERLSIPTTEPPTPAPAPEPEVAADAPPADLEARAAEHSVRMAIRRRQLELLRLKGGR